MSMNFKALIRYLRTRYNEEFLDSIADELKRVIDDFIISKKYEMAKKLFREWEGLSDDEPFIEDFYYYRRFWDCLEAVERRIYRGRK